MIINAHTHHLSKSDQSILDIYNQYPWNFEENNAYYSIGIHPIFIDKSNPTKDLNTIKEHLNDPKCLAIGEIGLDKITAIDFKTQKELFIEQLQIAQEYQKPVIIHCVRAYQEILKIKNELKFNEPFIFHGYNKNEQLAQQIINNNSTLSFGKNLLQNQNLQTIFANLSPENFFLENDDSQIPIEEIYHRAAEIRKISIEDLEIIISENFQRLFKHSTEKN